MVAPTSLDPGVPPVENSRRHVFISYTRADRAWVDRLHTMMRPLLRSSDQKLRLWDDSQIEPGAKWRQEIETALDQAQVAVLFVSDAFLASEFVMNEEVPKLLAAAEAEGVRVLWVSLSPCLVEHTPIHAYQAVLPLDHYLEELSRPEQQRALKRIAETIHTALTTRPLEPPPERQRQMLLEAPEAVLNLRMIQIPAGSFVMGSPADEPERMEREGPQHKVTLASFLLGQTPITQAQWREVAQWQPRQGERWERELKPTPSRFSDKTDSDQRPVEQVSWLDAMEFCSRLSQRTGRFYTLPSEAQWEYASRAGSTTPFHFGGTITPDLANYHGNYTYVDGSKGLYRGQTTPVASFPANTWGLHDMHGNVCEWCLDHWHDSYEGAPADGNAWQDALESKEQKDIERRLLRGGSWLLSPRRCRSAYRNHGGPVYADLNVGLRVVCLPQDPSLNP